ncbi:MAG TPA: acetylxylan esterase [Verrucomicrobiae bacterium]
MFHNFTTRLFLLLASSIVSASFASEPLPPADQRAGPPKTLDTLRSFPEINNRAQWEKRAQEIREQILVSCGLWPMPERPPLDAHISGKIERDGYSVERVYFQTYPGFYLAGNLYRPFGQGKGPFPAVLNPHGHWNHGRLEDGKMGSIPARCIQFARMGMIAFSYDMVGYNDTMEAGPHRQFALNPTNLLWNISLMGLQTWNSIRALDFLESLPDVDTKRLGCTGASGGGTQTFMLGAIDLRLAAQAPNVMVSHSMQGGCLCENAPGLRVDYSNMEIAAVPTPRPQILVAATGDWTKMTMEIEGPSLAHIYRLFRAEDHLRYVRFDFDHNYNQTSREAVYAWFDHWLLGHPISDKINELAFKKEPDDQLRVFPDGKLPSNFISQDQLIVSMIKRSKSEISALKPKDKRSFEHYKSVMLPAWRHTMLVEFPERDLVVEPQGESKSGEYTIARLALGRSEKGDRINAALLTPGKDRYDLLVLLAHPDGITPYLEDSGAPKGLAKTLLEQNHPVLLVETFQTGKSANPAALKARQHFTNFFPTYNRTDLQERVQDLITACAFGHAHSKGRRVVICGAGQAGLWALLAAPVADAVVADANATDLTSDSALIEQSLFVPGIRKIGAFEGAAALAAPNPLLVHNAGEKFATDWLRDTYGAVGGRKKFKTEGAPLADESLVAWIGGLK